MRIWIVAQVAVVLACFVGGVTFRPGSAIAAQSRLNADRRDEAVLLAGPVAPGAAPNRQGSRDLTATKTNTVGGLTTVGALWTWSVTVSNVGTLPIDFADGQIILVDELPTVGIAHGIPSTFPLGGTTGTLFCGINVAADTVTCFADGPVSISPGGSFRFDVTSQASAPGTFSNPRAGGSCRADPNNVVGEANEGNNDCADTVTASVPGAADLRVAKTNNLNGPTTPGSAWTWVLAVSNVGQGPATFAVGQTILTDALPNGAVAYGAPAVVGQSGVIGAASVSCSIVGGTLSCAAAGGNVTIGPGGTLQVAFTATASAVGTFANPRAGGICQVDPGNVVAEASEANNACSDAVIVAAQAAPSSPVSANNDDEEDDRPNQRSLTETQRHQRDRTNASGLDDVRTEGNVLEIRCDASTPPRYEVAFPTHTPYLVIATRDGHQQLRLLYDTRAQCQSIQVGRYAEADGEKQHELLFDVHNLTVK